MLALSDEAAIGSWLREDAQSAGGLIILREGGWSRYFPFVRVSPPAALTTTPTEMCICEQGHLHSVRELLAAGADTSLKVHIVEGRPKGQKGGEIARPLPGIDVRGSGRNRARKASAESSFLTSLGLGLWDSCSHLWFCVFGSQTVPISLWASKFPLVSFSPL